jgi:hypothetical protein
MQQPVRGDIGGASGRSAFGQVSGRGTEHAPDRAESAGDERGAAQGADPHHEVITLIDHVDEAVGQRQLNGDARMQPLELDDRRRQVQLAERHRRVELEHAPGLLLEPRQFAARLPELGNDSPAAVVELATGTGHRDTSGRPMQQLDA